MVIHWINECNHRLIPITKKFGISIKTLKCIFCECEMLDCKENRSRYMILNVEKPIVRIEK